MKMNVSKRLVNENPLMPCGCLELRLVSWHGWRFCALCTSDACRLVAVEFWQGVSSLQEGARPFCHSVRLLLEGVAQSGAIDCPAFRPDEPGMPCLVGQRSAAPC